MKKIFWVTACLFAACNDDSQVNNPPDNTPAQERYSDLKKEKMKGRVKTTYTTSYIFNEENNDDTAYVAHIVCMYDTNGLLTAMADTGFTGGDIFASEYKYEHKNNLPVSAKCFSEGQLSFNTSINWNGDYEYTRSTKLEDKGVTYHETILMNPDFSTNTIHTIALKAPADTLVNKIKRYAYKPGGEVDSIILTNLKTGENISSAKCTTLADDKNGNITQLTETNTKTGKTSAIHTIRYEYY